MAKEKNATTGSFVQELFQWGVYKKSQGRIARQVTFGILAVVFVLGAWRFNQYMMDHDTLIRVVLPAVSLVASLWILFRVMNVPRVADFLIAVEAEMNKVTWPSQTELIRSSLVVIFVIFFLAAILFGYDLFWNTLLHALRVLQNTPAE